MDYRPYRIKWGPSPASRARAQANSPKPCQDIFEVEITTHCEDVIKYIIAATSYDAAVELAEYATWGQWPGWPDPKPPGLVLGHRITTSEVS